MSKRTTLLIICVDRLPRENTWISLYFFFLRLDFNDWIELHFSSILVVENSSWAMKLMDLYDLVLLFLLSLLSEQIEVDTRSRRERKENTAKLPNQLMRERERNYSSAIHQIEYGVDCLRLRNQTIVQLLLVSSKEPCEDPTFVAVQPAMRILLPILWHSLTSSHSDFSWLSDDGSKKEWSCLSDAVGIFQVGRHRPNFCKNQTQSLTIIQSVSVFSPV